MNKYLHHFESCGEGLYGDVMFFVQKQVPNHIKTTTKWEEEKNEKNPYKTLFLNLNSKQQNTFHWHFKKLHVTFGSRALTGMTMWTIQSCAPPPLPHLAPHFNTNGFFTNTTSQHNCTSKKNALKTFIQIIFFFLTTQYNVCVAKLLKHILGHSASQKMKMQSHMFFLQ